MLNPLFDRVLLRRALKQKTGSLYMPESVQKKYAGTRCTVVAIGPDAFKDVETKVSVGDEVLIGQYSGAWVNEEGSPADNGEYYICNDTDLIAVIK